MATSLLSGYEREPRQPVGTYYRPPDSVEHLVSDGDDWYSVAARYKVPVKELIIANFKTDIPREVNWCLREYVRCDKATPDRKNWKFSTSSRHRDGPRAGVVYIPIDWPALFAAARTVVRWLILHWFSMVHLEGSTT